MQNQNHSNVNAKAIKSYNGFEEGTYAARKGRLCLIKKIHFEMHPPSVTVQMIDNDTEVGTEFDKLKHIKSWYCNVCTAENQDVNANKCCFCGLHRTFTEKITIKDDDDDSDHDINNDNNDNPQNNTHAQSQNNNNNTNNDNVGDNDIDVNDNKADQLSSSEQLQSKSNEEDITDKQIPIIPPPSKPKIKPKRNTNPNPLPSPKLKANGKTKSIHPTKTKSKPKSIPKRKKIAMEQDTDSCDSPSDGDHKQDNHGGYIDDDGDFFLGPPRRHRSYLEPRCKGNYGRTFPSYPMNGRNPFFPSFNDFDSFFWQ